jgi:hypothetical protein
MSQKDIDLTAVKNQCAQIQESAFSSMREYLQMSDEELRDTGHKTRESAVVACYRHAQSQIDRLWKAYSKKYPD